jgi:RNA polymerase sigma factor (sigma-70 family)
MNTFTTEERNALVLKNIFLAEKIALSRKKKLSHVSFEELKSAAYLGLVEAATNYNPDQNDCFPAFAIWRIIGAVRDYLREISWGPRSRPSKAFDIEKHEDRMSYRQPDFYVAYFEELITSLSMINKNILRLYYQEGMKIQEIASGMGVHQSRVSQILSESRSQLRNLWKNQEYRLEA